MSDNRVSVVIPTYRRSEAVIERAIGSLCDGRVVPEEILVVDQTPDGRGRLDRMVSNYSPASVVYLREPGLPNARNVGWKKASGDVILYCDDDVIAGKGLVESHRRNYRDPTIGGVGGRVRQSDLPEAPPNARVGRFRYWDGGFEGNFNARRRQEIHAAFGCNMSFRRDLLQQAGGFVRTYGGTAHLEEAEVCMKVRRLGFRIVFDPDAVLRHLHISTGGCRTGEQREWAYWYGHNYLYFFLRHFRWTFLPIFLVERVGKAFHFGIEAADPLATVSCLQGLLEAVSCYGRDRREAGNRSEREQENRRDFLFSDGHRCRHEKRGG